MDEAKGAICRRLILLRHAKSDWSTGVADHERPLAERGRRDAPRIGAYLAENGLVPDLVLVSSSGRTRETWGLVARAFAASPRSVIVEEIYEAEPSVLLDVIRRTEPEIAALMMIGHNPGLQELALELAKEQSNSEALSRLRDKFPTAALAVLDVSSQPWSSVGEYQADLERFVTPKSLVR